MGKIQQTEALATHFSHPHPFKLINYNSTLNLSPSCSGCSLKPSGSIYSCTVCSHFLHKKCFEMPKSIAHPSHKEHALILLPEPPYPEGFYSCDACREIGNGFSYHCKPCGVDLHILCATTPVSVTTAYHPHKLDLAFEAPYHTKSFVCDVCKGNGSNQWLYRCSLCGFDAHLKCVVGSPPVVGCQGQAAPLQQGASGSRSAPVPPPQGHGGLHFMAAAATAPQPPVQQSFMPHPMMNNAAVGAPAGGLAALQFGANRQNEMVLQAVMQMIQNNNAMTQAILAGGVGGIGGVGGALVAVEGASVVVLEGTAGGLQQLMQLMSGLNNSGFGGGGGSFGGGFGGDSGGLQQLMQLMSGLNNSGFGGGGTFGGGGGLQSLQSLLGGGGLDFLGGGGLDQLLGSLGGFL